VITSEVLKNCTDEEIGVLFYIFENSFSGCNVEPKEQFLKSLRVDVTLYELEKLKNKLKEEKKEFILNLQKKLYESQ
jgi:hypothetical protein